MFALEKRPNPSRFWTAATPVLAVDQIGLMMGGAHGMEVAHHGA